MNFLLLKEDEISKDGAFATILNDRCSYIRTHFALDDAFKNQREINVGVIGGNLGTGTIKEISNNSLLLKIKLDNPAPSKKDLTLIVSVCRPQTNKKILHIATSLGIKRIIFIRGENVPKSYLDSSSLNIESIQDECLLAMQQVGDTIFPETIIYKSIYECFNNESFEDVNFDTSLSPLYFVADTHCRSELNYNNYNKLSGVKCIAIGPESGWSEKEIEYFHKKSFKSIGLGDRILRVEVALCYLLGKISFLQ